MMSLMVPHEFEKKYVFDIYNSVSREFSKTRYSVWSCVKDFFSIIPKNETILEAGCGNGKNFIRENMYGIDACQDFVNECVSLNLNVKQGDILNINYPNDTFDNAMSIAVVHHLSTHERRKHSLEELTRVTKPNGLIFVLVMATDVHLKRTLIEENNTQDVLILFNNKPRYYHLFEENELISLLPEGVTLVKSFREKGNYGIYFRKN